MYNQTKIKILHIDDDLSYQKNLKETLAEQNFSVDCVDNFDTALKDFFLNNYDVILLEYRINNDEEKSLEFLEKIRNYDQKVTILVITNFINQDIVIKAIRLNIDDFINKSVNVQTLPDLINTRISKRRRLFSRLTDRHVDSRIEGNLFENFIVLKGSIPLLILGNWNDKPNDKNQRNEIVSDNDFLMSGFLSAIQNFSSNFFGQSVEEISLANSKMILLSRKEFTVCLKIENRLYRSKYSLENKRILINTLEKILSEIVFFFKGNDNNTLSESTKTHIKHILTEASVKTQFIKIIDNNKKVEAKRSYFKKLKDTLTGRKVSIDKTN